MKIKRQELLNVLNKIKPGISTNGLIDHTNCFIFRNNNVYTYDDKIGIKCDYNSDLFCSVSAAEFYKVIDRIKTDDIFLKQQDNTLIIKSKKTKIQLPIVSAEFEFINYQNIKKWKKLPVDFIEGLSLCIFSASKEMSSNYLFCLNIQDDKIISCDNLRLSVYTMNKKIEDHFLISVFTIQELIKFNSICEYSVDKSWIHFRDKENIVFSCRIMTGEYPECFHLLDIKETNKIIFPQKEVQNILDINNVLFSDEFFADKYVTLKIENDKLFCISENDKGKVKAHIDFESDVNDLEFHINPDFLYYILNKSVDCIVSDRSLLFKTDNFQHLICLYER